MYTLFGPRRSTRMSEICGRCFRQGGASRNTTLLFCAPSLARWRAEEELHPLPGVFLRLREGGVCSYKVWTELKAAAVAAPAAVLVGGAVPVLLVVLVVL